MSYLDEAAQDLAEAFRRMFITAFGHGYDFGCESKEGECKRLEAENTKLREQMERLVTLLRADCDIEASWDGLRKFWSIGLTEDGCLMRDRACKAEAESAKLRELVERLQPTDSDGNVLDIADTVHMLRSEYDGDHEWDDVVVELALTKWGGDRWIVRGSKGEAWACDCAKTGYDEDAYEGSDDVEPIANPTLIEADNAKLRELATMLHKCARGMLRDLAPSCVDRSKEGCGMDCTDNGERCCMELLDRRMRELGIEVDG